MILKINWDDKVYEYDPYKMLVSTAIVIKNHTGLKPMALFTTEIADLDPIAIQALMFSMKQQAGEPCMLAELDFDMFAFLDAFGAASAEYEAAEKAKEEGKDAAASSGPETVLPTTTSPTSEGSTSSS